MNRRADSHSLIGRGRTKGTAKFLAVLLIVTAGSAPYFASWHEAIVQHVRCADHGELTHVNSFHVHSGSPGVASAVGTSAVLSLSDVGWMSRLSRNVRFPK